MVPAQRSFGSAGSLWRAGGGGWRQKFRFSREFVESRRRGLETFVRRVARHPVLGGAEELQHFLKDSEDRWVSQHPVLGVSEEPQQFMNDSEDRWVRGLGKSGWGEAGWLGLLVAWRHPVLVAWRHPVLVAWRHPVLVAWRHPVLVAWRHPVLGGGDGGAAALSQG
ncbi:unnamed protein product [Closterium sp. NIES-65]|nr:unnamed protein product [Closterium sp. NIES-65]